MRGKCTLSTQHAPNFRWAQMTSMVHIPFLCEAINGKYFKMWKWSKILFNFPFIVTPLVGMWKRAFWIIEDMFHSVSHLCDSQQGPLVWWKEILVTCLGRLLPRSSVPLAKCFKLCRSPVHICEWETGSLAVLVCDSVSLLSKSADHSLETF